MHHSYNTYQALALQTTCHAVNACKSPAESREKMERNIGIIAQQIAASKRFIGEDLRLVVLPEYFMTGFPTKEGISEWREKAAIHEKGREYDLLSEIAQNQSIYLCGNAYEVDQHFPEIYFQTNFIIAPNGNTILRYRRLNSMYAPTPHDYWDRYLEIYGLEGVFPVADTELGKLATIASEEILYPEIARCLAVRGAEIFLHPTSEVSSPQLTPKDICKRARAIENMAYVISANSAGIMDNAVPAASTDGKSKIIDFQGRILAEADTGESMVAYTEIYLDSLRQARTRPGMNNLLARQRFELYQQTYQDYSFYPANSFSKQDPVDKKVFTEIQQEAIKKLKN